MIDTTTLPSFEDELAVADTGSKSTPDVIYLTEKVSPIILAGLFERNVSALYQHRQAGRFSKDLIDMSYLEAIREYIEYYRSGVEVKLAKEKAAQDKELAREKEKKERKKSFNLDGDDTIHPLAAAKMKQDIRLNRAREADIWQKAAIARGQYISLEQMIDICEPFLLSIKNSILAIGQEVPGAERHVDDALAMLHSLGKALLEDATEDGMDLVNKILETEIDYAEIDHEGEKEIFL